MAFAKFEVKKAPKKVVEKKANPVVEEVERVRRPTISISTNGRSGVILILGSVFIDRFGYEVGDRIDLYFDADSRSIGLRRSRNGGFQVTRHGASDRRFKVAIGKFYSQHLADLGLELPYKGEAVKASGGREPLVTLQLPVPVVRGRGRRRKLTPA